MKRKGLITGALILVLLASILSACVSKDEPDKLSNVADVAVKSYLAVAPKTMHSGEKAAVTFTLLGNEGQLTRDDVKLTLWDGDKRVVTAESKVIGKGQIEFNVPPDLPEGDYQLQVKGTGFDDKASVRVEKSLLVFLETDKPIYKPGQTVHIRAITLNSDLRPLSETVTVDVLDAKGIKIFRKVIGTDEYGTATLDLPLSDEPNLGTWKINASVGESKTQLDVRVEKYVLPKYEVKVDLPKEWFLASDPIKGTVNAEYSFGKPVKGELEIVASRYVGKWEVYATVTKEIDGQAQFEIPAVKYVAGVPEAKGMGNVTLDVTVKEQSTGYEEKTTRMFTIAQASLTIQIIPESAVFKPTLPFSFLIVTETPDNKLIDADVHVTVTYVDKDFDQFKKENAQVKTQGGKAILSFTPPQKATALQIEAFELTPVSSRQPAQATRTVEAGYSPSGNFIHVEQTSQGIPQVGQDVVFKVYSTEEATNFYYEIVSRDKVVFSDYTQNNEIVFMATPQMAPSARLLVYQILPNSEVAADYIPFSIDADYPNKVTVDFSKDEAKPGEEVSIDIKADGKSKVGIVAVDKSVFILAENRLNLQQVFDELEKLYMQPQVELHEVNIYSDITTRGASEIFSDAGVVVLSNKTVPAGKEYASPRRAWEVMGGMKGDMVLNAAGVVPPMATPSPSADVDQSLAEVQRVRQFFPETWLWQDITTDSNGKASINATVPDSITTWMLRAVALSKEKGLGIGEAQLKAFQPFFLSIDLPYSSIRGEEFPVKVAVYNYLNQTQEVTVKIDQDSWFDLLDEPSKSVQIAPSDVGGVEFKIRPAHLGINKIKITAQSTEAADAAIKMVIVEPEGVAREDVQNITLSGGTSQVLDTGIPALVVEDSGRTYLAVTASFLTQTIDGLDQLLQMPFGCGEQNMIVFAPDVFITRYLKESGQLKPEIMAKAEKLMITGYQRELTYRHRDGSFSAFGENDPSGSLWLTAFVLKSFAQAKGLIYIDDSVLSEAGQWITSHQKADGSFESVGFVHHQELLGGLQGKDALTAYVAIALMENSERNASGRAVRYLEGQLDEMDDPYTLALTAYALELAGSGLKDEAHEKLMSMAKEDENGLHWGSDIEILPVEKQGFARPQMMPPQNQSAVVETTAYATLALTKHGDAFNASRAAKWLVSKRNAYGGYGSTQDTVVALQALTDQASGARADVDLRVIVTATGVNKEIKITPENFDVLQIIDVPVNDQVRINVAGKGDAIAQLVKRYNLPQVDEAAEPIMKVNVDYDATEVEVNDIVKVSATVEFNPPIEMGMEMEAGMVVVDISVPTGFAPVTDTVAAVIENNKKFKRFDVAGRKVIFYIENMIAGEKISFSFDVQAMYPVKAKGVASTVYSYYQPELKGETLSQAIVVK